MSPIRDLHAERELSVRALRAGHVRLGQFTGGHPVESPTFVFTSADRVRLEPLAAALGGTIDRYEPQGGGAEPWRLVSEADAFTALFPFGDLEANVAQDWTEWGRAGLKRRCDGYDATDITTDEVTGERFEELGPCVCEATGVRTCQATTRVRLFLPTTGLVIWELVTHSKIGAAELFDQARFIDATTGGRMNHVPVRVVWAPRQIAYYDAAKGRRRTTTKRIVSLSFAGDAGAALAALNLPPDQALLAAVESVLQRVLPGARPRRALGDGSAPLEPGGGAGNGQGGGGEGSASPAAAADPTDVGAGETGEPPAEEPGPADRAAAVSDGPPSESAPAQGRDEDPAAPTRPSVRECSHPQWRPSTTRPNLELCTACGLGRRRVGG